MSKKQVVFDLQEPKKHSGKYVERGTEQETYPNMMYFKRSWFTGELPKTVTLTVEAGEHLE